MALSHLGFTHGQRPPKPISDKTEQVKKPLFVFLYIFILQVVDYGNIFFIFLLWYGKLVF